MCHQCEHEVIVTFIVNISFLTEGSVNGSSSLTGQDIVHDRQLSQQPHILYQ